jgi:inner membrane protein
MWVRPTLGAFDTRSPSDATPDDPGRRPFVPIGWSPDVYQRGHHGVSLLVFAPVGHFLIEAGEPLLAFLVGGVMLSLAMLPDVDQKLPVPHRGPTHSLLFAAAVGGVFAGIGHVLAPVLPSTLWLGLSPAAFGFALGALSILAHLLGDTLTPMGVDYFWPIDYDVSVGLVTAGNTTANYALLGLGVAAVAAAVYTAIPG